MTRLRKRLNELETRITAHYSQFGRRLDSECKYYTYALLDPRKPGTWEYNVCGRVVTFPYEPFYVGKGKGQRMRAHLEVRKQALDRNTHKKNIIAKVRRLGLEPIALQVSPKESEVSALAKEHLLIVSIGRADKGLGPLANLTNGGQGPSGYVHTQELRDAVSKAHTGKVVSAETRRKLSIANTGKTHSAETRAKLSAIGKEKVLTEEHKAKIAAGNRGKKMSAESIAKGQRTKASRPPKPYTYKPRGQMSDEARANMRAAALKRAPMSEETRAKLSAFQKTRPRRKWTAAEKLAHSKLKKAQYAAKLKKYEVTR